MKAANSPKRLAPVTPARIASAALLDDVDEADEPVAVPVLVPVLVPEDEPEAEEPVPVAEAEAAEPVEPEAAVVSAGVPVEV